MKHRAYNLIWCDDPPPIEDDYESTTHGECVADEFVPTRAVILFPSFATPFLYFEEVDEAWIELLIASELPLTAERVNRQLKVSPGLDPAKPCAALSLFGGGHANNIQIEAAPAEGAGAVRRTHGRFEGILHHAFATRLSKKNLGQFSRVKVSAETLRARDETYAQDFELSETVEAFVSHLAPARAPARRGLELHDEIIREMLTERFGPDTRGDVPGRMRYCFQRRSAAGDVDLKRASPDRPVQSYHPVFVVPAEHASNATSFGFVSDIHVNCRLALLGRSTARVIEYDAQSPHRGESPQVGDLLAETNRSFANVLDRLCQRGPTAMILGGDFIDHMRNAYSRDLLLASDPGPARVWEAVDISGDAYTLARYPYGLDFTAFYTFIFDAASRYSMPFFALSGNHDAYREAFGISPRVSGIRANEGIPGDLNLTIYEALLAFGPSAGLVVVPATQDLNFIPEWFDWLYTVLTPFSDYSFKLPHQTLTALGWGEREDMVTPNVNPLATDEEQGGGHLPWATTSVSEAQLQLVRNAVADAARRVVLATHFTFVSYVETRPLLATGGFKYLTHGRYTVYEMGTFASGGDELFGLISSNQIPCVISGHSHRRAIYKFIGRDARGALTQGYDFSSEAGDLTPAGAVMIVSDSAGPYPKRNLQGEFQGWGLSRPSGTLIEFTSRGLPAKVAPVYAQRAAPRAAVALDYLHLHGGVFKTFNTPGLIATIMAQPEGWEAWFYLSDHVRDDLKADVTAVRLVRWRPEETPVRIAFAPVAGNRWFSSESLGLSQDSETRWFISLELSTERFDLASEYDWESAWNIEVTPELSPSRGDIFYLKQTSRSLAGLFAEWVRSASEAGRNQARNLPLYLLSSLAHEETDGMEYPEVPDFMWRAQHLEKYR